VDPTTVDTGCHVERGAQFAHIQCDSDEWRVRAAHRYAQAAGAQAGSKVRQLSGSLTRTATTTCVHGFVHALVGPGINRIVGINAGTWS